MEKVVVVGAGGIAPFWLDSIAAEGVEVAAIVDLDQAKAEALRQAHCAAAVASSDLGATLARTRPDLVIDLTPPEARTAVTCTALEAGFPVLCEKPLADSLETAREVAAVAERSGRMCMVSQSRRWEEGPASVRLAVKNGVVGPLASVHCDFFLAAHFGDCELTDAESGEEAYALATAMDRRTMPSPLLRDMAVHHFDMMRFMTGLDPVAVYAQEFNPRGSWYDGACSAICIFEMTEGVSFSYRGSWSAEGFPTDWNGNWRVIGEKGTVLYENGNRPKAQVATAGGGFRLPLVDVDLDAANVPYPAMRGALHDMLVYLRTGAVPQTTSRDNVASCAMVEAALASARSGKRVPIEGAAGGAA